MSKIEQVEYVKNGLQAGQILDSLVDKIEAEFLETSREEAEEIALQAMKEEYNRLRGEVGTEMPDSLTSILVEKEIERELKHLTETTNVKTLSQMVATLINFYNTHTTHAERMED